MDYKLIALLLFALSAAFQAYLYYLDLRSADRDIPDNVKDVYDPETYRTWQNYSREGSRLGLTRHLVSSLVTFLVLAFDLYARLVGRLPLTGLYLPAMAVLVLDALVDLVVSTPFNYKNQLGIEEKYGFNRMDKKTFFIDLAKDTLIGLALTCGILCLFIWVHQALGNWLLLVFTAIMVVFLLAVFFIAPALGKIHNKFEPLPEGDLRRRLEELLTQNGCVVKAINVMDGSKRSTKANAYFSGFGRSKTIVLYDTLLEQMTDDEIVAVFAHEMGHNKHKDTLKMYPVSILQVAIMVALAWALVSVPEICQAFGFEGVNYGFAFWLMASVCLNALAPFVNLFSTRLSRKAEYAADRFAAENGYGPALISALKKLSRSSFACLNPHPTLVALSYSHPTVSQRVAALEQVK